MDSSLSLTPLRRQRGFVVEDVRQHLLPTFPHHEIHHRSQHVPHFFAPTDHLPALLKQTVAFGQDQVRDVGQEIQIIKDRAQVLLSVSVVVRQMIAVILLHIKLLVLDLPLRSPDPD